MSANGNPTGKLPEVDSEFVGKGPAREEVVRAYFLRAGYYAMRSVQFQYSQFKVTDVDIWLYERPSSVSRHRIIVDVKNRKTPQAIERIFWTKGLQLALGVEQSIVATTDKRREVSEFGREHGVIVLDGDFVNRLGASVRGVLKDRLTEEEFYKILSSISETWKVRISRSRSLVLRGLDYDSINFWLEEARYFTEQFLQQPSRLSDAPLRVTYVLVSLIAIAFDFLSRELAFVASQGKYSAIVDGLRYGKAGRASTIKVVEIAAGLAERYLDAGRVAGTRLRSGFETEIADLRVNILGEYFSRSSSSQTLFGVARELEHAAYAKEFVKPWNLSVEGQALIGVLADYWDIDRSKLLNALPSSSAPAPTLAG